MLVAFIGVRASVTMPSTMCICKCCCTEALGLPPLAAQGTGEVPVQADRGRRKGRKVDLAHEGMQASQLRRAAWRKSRYSNPSGNCVEMAELPAGGVAIRNSRYPEGPALIFTRAEWEAFLRGARDGGFG